MHTRRAAALVVLAVAIAVGILPTASIGGQARAHSVARAWNEALLGAIRLDVPAPTVHARNLFHLSVAMYDAWAAYDPVALGYLVQEKIPTAGMSGADVAAARDEAISYAAYRLLVHRFAGTIGADTTLPALDALMDELGYDRSHTDSVGDAPAALGNRIAAAIIAHGLQDGANEANGYADTTGYAPVNVPLFVGGMPQPCPGTLTCIEPGAPLDDPNRWQPLSFDLLVLQNDIVVGEAIQVFIGSHWGGVTPFALEPAPGSAVSWSAVDPGPPPLLGGPGDDEFKAAILQVLRFSGALTPDSGELIELSPAGAGNRVLGTHVDRGYDVNPATGAPYAPNVVPLGDYGRVVAEFWADGPDSETPPGHWNVLANAVSDDPRIVKRLGGAGPVLDDLEWDVKLYLALNGAVHDAAIAAWGAKAVYDYVRPISMARYMGRLGQSSDPAGPSYHPDGLPLEEGLVEVITAATAAPGQRHAHLAGFEGEIAVRAWARTAEGEPLGVQWIRAADWFPYQLPTFVTPSFAGYVSGHSTFSRAAAEVLTAFTGNPYFPGGLGEFFAPAGEFLEFEDGPSVDVTLQWATYRDAADEAGISRLYGGIHVRADDFGGRIMGATIGPAAYALATRYFAGDPSLRDAADANAPASQQPPDVDALPTSGNGGLAQPDEDRAMWWALSAAGALALLALAAAVRLRGPRNDRAGR